AIDAARAALRLSAESVRVLYRRGESSLSAFSFEYEQAKREGVVFHWWTQPVGIVAMENSPKLDAIDCVRTATDSNGGLRPIAESRFAIPCDMVISAVGQVPLLEGLSRCRGVDVY